MRYGDLIQFDPIETIIQLRHADQDTEARRLVATYVVSAEMADRLTALVLPQLQFERPADNKGLLIVGNYGTGKSHLLSVLSAVAEHAPLAGLLRNPQVAAAAPAIAGKFQVLRTELGSTRMDFRDFVCDALEQGLARRGIAYRFPPRDRIPNHKDAFAALMAAFHERYPHQGLLLVVDELLDFLRSRKDQELILDLNFLREVGEVRKDLRFRFVAGLQEMLFDNSRFAFAADTIKRVKDRFEQVLIARKDVQFVVAERLLGKTPEQQARVRAHLSRFARFYPDMNPRLEEFVRLFPVHPNYLETFERIRTAEKREVLKTLSRSMQRLLDQDVPADNPGVLAYDSYWCTLLEEPAFRAEPDVRAVSDCSQVLAARIQQAFTRPAYRPLALRLIAALSVHRLTTEDVYKPVGPTAAELRDQLCLYQPGMEDREQPAEDLQTHIETVLREIMRTVNGQFLSRSGDTGQYHLDLKKDVDYDALIDKRAEALEDNLLDRYYYDALKRALECTDETYVTGYHIWQDEVEWTEHRTLRQGYLFFGAPNERSTAVPQRDFYLYFIQPHDPPRYKDEKRPDEVFFHLAEPDDTVRQALRRYAAALEQAATASGQPRTIYLNRARGSHQELVQWFGQHMTRAFKVTHRGKSRRLLEWLKGAPGGTGRANMRDLVHAVASVCLAPHFQGLAPEYPRFTVLISGANRAQAAQDALRWLRGLTRTQQAGAVLDALELLDGGKLAPAGSRYAGHLLSLLQRKGQGQVVNRSEILQEVQGQEYFVPGKYRLEPEWVIVLLAALVQDGKLVLAIPGQKFDALNGDALATTPLRDLLQFKHVERPAGYNVAALRALFELLDLGAERADRVILGEEEPVQELQRAATRDVERLVIAGQHLHNGLAFWGRPLLTAEEQASVRARLEAARDFLESLQAYNTAGRFRKYTAEAEQVQGHRAGLKALREVEALQGLVSTLGPAATYLSQAEVILPEDHPWQAQVRQVSREVLAQVQDPGRRQASNFVQATAQKLAALKKGYIEAYLALHGRARLGVTEEKRRAQLLRDPRLARLSALSQIDILPAGQLGDFKNRLSGHRPALGTVLHGCPRLTEQDLQTGPLCPHCRFNPLLEGIGAPVAGVLGALDEELDKLLADWTRALLENLQDPDTRARLELLSPRRKRLVNRFLDSQAPPEGLNPEFIDAVREVFEDLVRVDMKAEDLLAALLGGGSPATLAEMRKRFEQHLDNLTKGQDPDKVRLVLECETPHG